MATVIDSLIVTLGLDGSKFSAGAKQAKKESQDLEKISRRNAAEEKRRASEQDKSMRKASDNYRRLRNDALALGAVFMGGMGIKDFVSNTIDSAVNLGYLSQNLGQSTERLKAWQLASERAGGSQQGVIAQLKESVDSIAALNSGLGPNEGMQWFFRMGGSSQDLKDGNTYLLARSKIISDIFRIDPGKAALIAKQMGISEDQFNFIKQGPDAIEDLIRAQEKHTAVTAKDAAAALKLKNQMLDLRDSLQATATRIILQLAPTLEELFKKLEKGADWVAEHKEDIAQWVNTSIEAIREFIHWADSAAESLGGWKNVLIALIGLKLGGTILGLAGIAAQLASIGSAAPGALALLGKGGALGGAALGGYAAGTYAYNNILSEETKDAIGGTITEILARFGSEDAKYVSNLPRSSSQQSNTPIRPKSSFVPSNAQAILTEKEIEYGLPLGTLDAQWFKESSRGKNMLSPAGAMGHFGFMPKTAKEYGLKDPNDFMESSDAAARKMRDLLKQYGGDLRMAAAAYNFGQGNLARTGFAGSPFETRDYANYVANSARGNVRRTAPMGSTSTTSNEVNIENLTVTTQARDAEGMARGAMSALEKYNFANNANSGMTP